MVSQKYGTGDWWAQTVTVGYERIKGLRDRGQRRSGAYEAGKSKTFNVPVQTLFEAWADESSRRKWIGRVRPTVRTAKPSKSIRLHWPDSTIVVIDFTAKSDSKSVATVTHTKLPDKAASDTAKKEWTARLDELTSFLGAASAPKPKASGSRSSARARARSSAVS